jgi:hypothetical protein
MTLQALWAHGTVGVTRDFNATIDLAGLSLTPGAASEANVFFPLPTPVILNGNRSRLLRVFALYELSAAASIGPVYVYDSQNDPGEFDANNPGQQPVSNYLVAGPVNYTGVNGLNDLIDNRTRFNYADPPYVYFGLTLAITVRLGPNGLARFTSVGADYDA